MRFTSCAPRRGRSARSILPIGPLAAFALLAALTVAGDVHAAPPATSGTEGAAQAVPKPLDLNAATEADLVALPRVGPALAKRIVEHRKAAGGFRKVDELANVKGIGDRTLELLRPLVTVSAPAKAAPGEGGKQ